MIIHSACRRIDNRTDNAAQDQITRHTGRPGASDLRRHRDDTRLKTFKVEGRCEALVARHVKHAGRDAGLLQRGQNRRARRRAFKMHLIGRPARHRRAPRQRQCGDPTNDQLFHCPKPRLRNPTLPVSPRAGENPNGKWGKVQLTRRQTPAQGKGRSSGNGAGSGNRTRIFSLEGCCSTIELYPRSRSQDGRCGTGRQSKSTRLCTHAVGYLSLLCSFETTAEALEQQGCPVGLKTQDQGGCRSR